MRIKKNFFAPLALGLGATQRAAMLLLVMLLTTATAWAQGPWQPGQETSGLCGDDLTWELTQHDYDDFYTLTISGTGAMYDYGDPSVLPWYSYADQIQEVVIKNGVTSIGSYVFQECDNLASITVEAGNTVYDSRNGCNAIIEKSTNKLIIGCKNSTIPTGVTSIGDYAFSGCLGLTSIEIPASVTSIGNNAFYECHSLQVVTFAEGSQLTSIGYCAFEHCEALTSIEIPASVTSIGSDVFLNCDNLASITVEAGNTVYDSRNGCNAIIVKATNTLIIGCNNSTIPAGVTSIGERAFSGSDLTSITIPASVTSIGGRAFLNCHNLATVTVYAPSCSLGEDAFAYCFNLANIYVFSDLVDGYKDAENWSSYKDKIKGMVGGYCGTTDHETDVVWVLTGESTNYTLTISGTGAMYDYDNPFECPWNSYAEQINEVVIKNGVTSIGSYVFQNCNNLASMTVEDGNTVYDSRNGCNAIIEKSTNTLIIGCKNSTIPAGVTSIGAWAFYNTGLTSIEIPASVTSIGDNAFDNCSSMTSITIPASVTSIGEAAFFSCGGLTSVSFAEGSQLKSIGNNAFRLCSNLTSITIPASVTSIGSYVFQNCNLASMTVEDGNTVYDSRNGCNAIIEKSTNTLIIGCKNSTIPAGVTSIGAWAFFNTDLTSIEIPASVTSIGMHAFQNCPNLATVTVYAPSCTLGDNAFLNCNNLANIYVFSDLVDDYKAAWSAYTSIITEMPNPNGKCGDNVRWALTGESPNYTLTISGTGAMADYASSSVQPWKNYRSSIKTVVIGNGVTSIGNYTFAKCTGLTSIEIPASVTSIGDNAFWECSNLATVTFAEDSQLATIGNSAFSKCSGLTSIEIPASVTSIGDNAFHYCSGLATVSFAAGSQLTSIGDYAFEYCSGLTSIEIPASVTSIGRSAFASCSNLEAMIVDGGNTVYDSRNGCNAIIEKSSNTLIAGCKNTTIPDGVTSIRMRAFYGCTGLASIEIPASVTSIGDNAFANCSNLEAITVEDGNAVYDSRNGCNAIIEKSTNTLIIGCNNSTIPASVTSIGERAFYNTGLTSIEIPASVTSIGGSAFYGCSGLTSIEIPASVTSIRSIAFRNCSNLATVTVYAPSCSLGEDAFANCNNLTNIYVFSNLVGNYKGAEHWSTYADKIIALPTVTTSYVDADGTLHENVDAVPLNNVMTTLPAGTYVVNSDVAYTGTITLNGDVNIILADGKTMTASGNSHGIYGDGSLTIYGQALGTGTLDVTGTNYGILYYAGNVVIRGGTVNATGTNNIGIYADGYITITGGKVTATGDEAGIYSDDGNITLGWTSASDFITAESYSASLGIIVKAGQTLTDGISTYSGTLTDEQKIAIAEKVLTPPTYSVTANRATAEDTEYWSTFYHPAAGYTADENTTVYQAAVNTTTNNVELTAVPGREIPAGKAVVLKSTQSAITLSRATTTQTLDGNELKGGSTVADGKVPYTLAAKGDKVGFYKFVGAALNPNKAHLEITAPAQSAPAFFGFEENTTAINEHELHESHELSGAWYSLDGRKLSGEPSAKGIYVRNGRKFIIK